MICALICLFLTLYKINYLRKKLSSFLRESKSISKQSTNVSSFEFKNEGYLRSTKYEMFKETRNGDIHTV